VTQGAANTCKKTCVVGSACAAGTLRRCGWKSGCPHCSAWRVFHKIDRTLRCHHCGFTERVPRSVADTEAKEPKGR
jgi:hypothetical protein